MVLMETKTRPAAHKHLSPKAKGVAQRVSAPSWAIDPGGGVAFQADNVARRLLVHRLPGAGKLGGDAALLVAIPASCQKHAGACGQQNEKLRRGLEPKARPKRSRFDSRNEVGCKPAWREAEVGSAVAYGDAAPAAEPARRRRDQAEANFVAVEFAHLAAEVGQAVDQPELERLPAGPELAGEEVVSSLLDAHATSRLDEIDELGMRVALDGLDPLHVFLLHRQERVERGLVAAGSIDAALDADLVDQLVQTEGGGDDADRADDRACIGIDLVAGDREQVASRRGDVLGEHIDLQTLLLGKRADALVDQHRLHGGAAWRVDLDGDRIGPAHGEGLFDR